jgi:hypothetical protein
MHRVTLNLKKSTLEFRSLMESNFSNVAYMPDRASSYHSSATHMHNRFLLLLNKCYIKYNLMHINNSNWMILLINIQFFTSIKFLPAKDLEQNILCKTSRTLFEQKFCVHFSTFIFICTRETQHL